MLSPTLLSEIEFTASRSSGPGGQNVNKVNSKAQLRWCVATSQAFDEVTRSRLMSKLAHRMTNDGEIIISSEEFRDLPRNKAACERKLAELIQAALHVPKPRKKTKPSRSTKIKRAESRKKHSQKKKLRQKSARFD